MLGLHAQQSAFELTLVSALATLRVLRLQLIAQLLYKLNRQALHQKRKLKRRRQQQRLPLILCVLNGKYNRRCWQKSQLYTMWLLWVAEPNLPRPENYMAAKLSPPAHQSEHSLETNLCTYAVCWGHGKASQGKGAAGVEELYKRRHLLSPRMYTDQALYWNSKNISKKIDISRTFLYNHHQHGQSSVNQAQNL